MRHVPDRALRRRFVTISAVSNVDVSMDTVAVMTNSDGKIQRGDMNVGLHASRLSMVDISISGYFGIA